MSKPLHRDSADNINRLADAGEDRLLTIREVSEITGLAVGSLYHLLLREESRPLASVDASPVSSFGIDGWWDELSEYPSDPARESFSEMRSKHPWQARIETQKTQRASRDH